MPFARTANRRISYTVSGPTEAVERPQTLLMIMGLAGSGAMWFRLLPHVVRRHRAIVFDNRGTGLSSAIRGPLTMGNMVRDALAVLDAAEVPEAHVLGASMGGMIAQHLALDQRPRVRSLILACTTAGGRREPPNLRLVAASLMRPLIGQANAFALVTPALYSPQSRTVTPERVWEDMRIRGADRVGALTPVLQGAAIAGHDTRSRLHDARRSADAGAPRPRGQAHPAEPRARARRPDSRRQAAELSGAGHLLATDAEQQVADAVIGHIDGHAKRRRRQRSVI